MLWFAVMAMGAEPPDAVTLRLGVHRAAGTVHGIAVDGAAGQCTVGDAWIHCPASGPVTFRWGQGGEWVLVGDDELLPGEDGVAWVLVGEVHRADTRERLSPGTVTVEDVRDIFVRTGDNPIEAPSMGVIEDLVRLASHPDPLVRVEVVDGLVPYWRHTASDPFPVGAPVILPDGLITQLSEDPDKRVRRRLANRLRDVLERGEPLAEEAITVLLALAGEGGGVQRAALSSLGVQVRGDLAPALLTWTLAMDRVAEPSGPGRAAANTLAHLAGHIEPGPDVDPVEAVRRVFVHHRESTWRVWAAWRHHVPFDRTWAEPLVRQTLGHSPRLIQHWAQTNPADLQALLHDWEPNPPHSDRYRAITRVLRRADNLSPEPATPPDD